MKTVTAIILAAWLLMATPATAQEEPVKEDQPTQIEEQTVTVVDVILVVADEQVSHLSPDTKTQVTMILRNDGDKAIEGGALLLEGFGEDVKVEPAEVQIDDLAPGARTKATFSLTVGRASCYEPLGIGASIRAGDTLTFLKAEIPAVCPGSKVNMWTIRYAGGDDDGIPEPGEELDVFVTLRNDGRDPGRDLTGVLKSRTDGVRILRGEATWPTIDKGEEKEQTRSFRIAIDDSVEVAEGCGPMIVEGPPATDGDQGVSSDDGQVVSSDGTVAPDAPDGTEPADGTSSGSSGGGAPGSTGSGEAIEPMPAEDLPAEEGTTEPDPGTPDPGTKEEPAPEPQDESAIFQLMLTVNGADTEFEQEIGGGSVCAMEGRPADAKGEGVQRDDLLGAASTAEDSDAGSGTAPTALAGILVAAVAIALGLARRYLVAMQ